MKSNIEEIAKVIAFLTLPIVLIISRFGNDYVQIALGIGLLILCNSLAIFFLVIGVRSKSFLLMVFIVNLAIGICVAMSLCKVYSINVNYLVEFFPIICIIGVLTMNKIAHRHFDNQKYKSIRSQSILIIFICIIFQILLVYALFFKKR